ncbi:MAG: HAD-IIIA family hydrolase [Thermodesulfobacteriota bacterium]|nr:HAD-IIIA family hydrolase [Thermodesulfobacteriota bacterium]
MNTVEENIVEKAKDIRLLLLDADGVLTDGKILYDDTGRELKRFDIRDGHGIKLLMRAGIEVGIITGRESKALEFRARELGISILYQKIYDKMKVYKEILNEKELTHKQICYVGDDLVDVPLLKRVGFSVAVPDGSEYAKETAHYITLNNGGNGAVREVCEIILKAQDKWNTLTQRYFQ